MRWTCPSLPFLGFYDQIDGLPVTVKTGEPARSGQMATGFCEVDFEAQMVIILQACTTVPPLLLTPSQLPKDSTVCLQVGSAFLPLGFGIITEGRSLTSLLGREYRTEGVDATGSFLFPLSLVFSMDKYLCSL